MLESRWGRRLGPGIAAMGAILAIASTTLGAPAVEGRPPPACSGGTSLDASPGAVAWYRLDPVLAAGSRVGQRLDLGRVGGRTWTMRLAPESFATTPTDGRIVVGTDDGIRSTVSVVDVERGCATIVATSTDVIRRAVIAPDGATVYEFRVRRTDRADLGLWRRTPGHDAVRVVDPISADATFGITWTTDLAWSTDGRSLAMTSCGEVACRTRVVDVASGDVRAVTDPQFGRVVGLADDHLVVRGACRGLPCPLIAVDLRDASARTLAQAAGLAALVVGDDRRPLVVHELDPGGGLLRTVALDGVELEAFPPVPDGLRLLSPSDGSEADLPIGWLALARDGRLPARPEIDARARRLADGITRRLDEVLP
ncbi:MAG: hypothetical protein ABIQ58_08195 [Candidatus Limnocylindrales bacterium]